MALRSDALTNPKVRLHSWIPDQIPDMFGDLKVMRRASVGKPLLNAASLRPPQDLTAAEPHPVRPRSAPLAPLPPRSAAEGRPKRPSSASQVRGV